jgi:hypothetical protein
MVLSAIGMKPPGFASAAPAPTIAITGELATLLIWSTVETLRIRWPPQNPDDPDDEQDRGDYVHYRDPGLRLRWSAGGCPVAEHERGDDSDHQRRAEGTDVEP